MEIVILLQELNKILPGGLGGGFGFLAVMGIIVYKIASIITGQVLEAANIWRNTVIEQHTNTISLFKQVQLLSDDFLHHNEALTERSSQQHERSITIQLEAAKTNAVMVDKLNHLLEMVERLCHISTGEKYGAQKPKVSPARRSLPSSKAKGVKGP